MKQTLYIALLCICTLFGTAASIASEEKITALKSQLETVQNDTEKAAVLQELIQLELETAPSSDVLMQHVQDLSSLAQTLNNQSLEALALHYLGLSYNARSNYENALNSHQGALTIRQTLGEQKNIASSLLEIGIAQWRLGNYDDSLRYCLDALKIYESEGDRKGEAEALHNIAIVYDLLQNWDQALDFHDQALAIREDIGDKKGIASSYKNIGIVYYFLKDYDNALKYYEQSLQIQQEINDVEGAAGSLNNIGFIYEENLAQPKRALEYYLQSLAMYEDVGANRYEIANISNNIGRIHTGLGESEKAEQYLIKSRDIAKEIEAKELLRENYKFFSNMYAGREDYKDALDYYKLSAEISNEIFNDNASKQIAEMQEKYESDKKQQELERQQLINYIFIGGGVLLLILVGVVFNRYRFQKKTNAELAEAHRLISQEKEKSDKLLLNILPVRVANDLKERNATEPESFDNVTVYFSDIVGFTKMSSQLEPKLLIDELNEIFTQFDNIIEQYGCERIKTIGDAYMCVCGMPEENPQHASNVVSAALKILTYLENRNIEQDIKWQIRIGIHSGKVVGGVVGVKKYIYDVFGDTINTASRMESSSEPMKINISEATYQILQDSFICVPRGAFAVKGKGQMNMYFVEGMNSSNVAVVNQ